MQIKKETNKSYNLCTIKTEKFKMCHIEVIFRNNVNVNEITIRNVLFDTLIQSSKKYPTSRLKKIRLEELYNASIYTVTSKNGNAILTSVCLDFLNPEYSEDSIIEDSIKLLFEFIFNPLVTNNEFENNTVEYIKNRQYSDIKSIIENPTRNSIINALKSLGSNTPTSYDVSGNIEDVSKINPSNLYEYYKKVLDKDYIDIYAIGNMDMEKVSNIIKKYNKFNTIKNHEITYFTKEEKRKEITNYEETTYNQTNLVCFLNLNNLTEYEKNYVANIYNIILGGGSLQTKLSKKLRINNSLCYNVSSSYLKYDNLIMIYTGITTGEEDKAIKLIKEAIKEMKKNITDEELTEAKELILTSLKMIPDSPGRIIDDEFFNELGLIDKLDTRIEQFKEITKEEIYNLSNKISLCNIYCLRGNPNEEN